MLKDQTNKESHDASAQVACEAAGSIRTVASLTREDSCSADYSQSLEEPMVVSNRSAIRSNALFALTQSLAFFCIALVGFVSVCWRDIHANARATQVFWYGSRLVSTLEYDTRKFFICKQPAISSSERPCDF